MSHFLNFALIFTHLKCVSSHFHLLPALCSKNVTWLASWALQRLSLNPTACATAITLLNHTRELSWILSLPLFPWLSLSAVKEWKLDKDTQRMWEGGEEGEAEVEKKEERGGEEDEGEEGGK